MSIVMEPGTVRAVHYLRPRTTDGKYPVTYWGTVEEQIAEATAENARATSSRNHKQMQLYTYTEDCEHSNPEDDEKYAGVDDLVDEWMARNCPGLERRPGDDIDIHSLIWKNKKRAYAVIPLANEWWRAQNAYDDGHAADVCLGNPMGTCCTACTEGDDDFGYEPGACSLATNLREEYDAFWDRVSPEGRDYRLRQEPGVHVTQELAAVNRRIRAQIDDSARAALIRIGIDPDRVRREERFTKRLARCTTAVEAIGLTLGTFVEVLDAAAESLAAFNCALEEKPGVEIRRQER